MKICAAVVLLAVTGTSFAPQDTPKKPAADPAARQEEFLAALKAGEIEKAYDGIVRGSRLEGQEALSGLKAENEKGIKIYGGISTWENFGIVRQEKYQAFGMAIVCCEHGPLFYYFIWYRKSETSPWGVTTVWFNDQVKDYWNLRR